MHPVSPRLVQDCDRVGSQPGAVPILQSNDEGSVAGSGDHGHPRRVIESALPLQERPGDDLPGVVAVDRSLVNWFTSEIASELRSRCRPVSLSTGLDDDGQRRP